MKSMKHLLRQLPAKLQKKYAHPPRAGSGVHQWIFRMALASLRYLTPPEVQQLLTAAVAGCGRVVEPREILEAVKNAGLLLTKPQEKDLYNPPKVRGNAHKKSKWPAVNEPLRSKIVAEGCVTTLGLKVVSPIQVRDGSPSTKWFLDQLFELHHNICIGIDTRSFETQPLAYQLSSNLGNRELIVPSPMSSKYGLTKDGKRSQHTLSNTGPRRYLVTEFDSGTAEEQASIIGHLMNYAPLAMVLGSGGKSLHAWWNCHGVDEARVLEFFRFAVSLGADPATWTPSQFVRLPQAIRYYNQRRQQVLYFDPCALPPKGKEVNHASV